MFLSRFASEVYLLIRGDSLHKTMSRYLIDQIEATANISVMVNTQITAVDGDASHGWKLATTAENLSQGAKVSLSQSARDCHGVAGFAAGDFQVSGVKRKTQVKKQPDEKLGHVYCWATYD